MNGSVTTDRTMGLLRVLLNALGPLAVAMGWLNAEQVGAVTSALIQIVGALMTVGGVFWSWKANSKSSITQSIAALPETQVKPGTNGTATVTILDPSLRLTRSSRRNPKCACGRSGKRKVSIPPRPCMTLRLMLSSSMN